MFQPFPKTADTKQNYQTLLLAARGLLSSESNDLAKFANMSALLNYFLDDINWVGFYFIDKQQANELVLGPFQGLPACTRITLGKGVCGTAASTNSVLRISDVHQFEGHIACDTNSQSEIVLPLVKNGTVIGVLDIDAPIRARFSAQDQTFLEQFVEQMMTYIHTQEEV